MMRLLIHSTLSTMMMMRTCIAITVKMGLTTMCSIRFAKSNRKNGLKSLPSSKKTGCPITSMQILLMKRTILMKKNTAMKRSSKTKITPMLERTKTSTNTRTSTTMMSKLLKIDKTSRMTMQISLEKLMWAKKMQYESRKEKSTIEKREKRRVQHFHKIQTSN